MKNKIILGTIIGTFLIASAGCSNTKTLTCTSESQESGAKLTQQVLVTFDKNDTLSHVKITTKIDAEDDYADEMDEYEEMIKETVDSNEEEHIKISYKRNGNSLSQVMDYYVSDMSDEEKENNGFDDPDENSYDTLKENFEEQGYTCK